MKDNGLDWQTMLSSLAATALSERGRKACLKTCPLDSAEAASVSTENILQALVLLEKGSLELSVLDSLPPILERLDKKAVLNVEELIEFRRFLNVATFQKLRLKEGRNSWCTSQFSKISEFRSQLSAIDHVLSPAGEINEHASETLQSLCDEKRKLKREISRTLDLIVQRRQMESVLQDKYVTNREGRMVIPVKSGNQHDLKGIIHDASQSKQTVFMEPEEVIPMNNRLREVEILVQEEIYRILGELSEYLARFYTAFANADAALLECDVVMTKASFAQKMKATQVKFSDTFEFNLKDLRHPLLVIQGVDVVPNTVHLSSKRRVLLLSGPNAGGKTILLKAIGLAAQLGRCGLPIPADEGSSLPFFKVIDSIVGDLQSVGENLSSFSSHVGRLTESLKFKSPNTLLLIDEICGSTDPEEGAALARSFIESFCEQEIFAIVTSHLGPLKENWSKQSLIEHGSLEFNLKSNRPTYQLLMGFPGRSLALSVASRIGVPEDIISRARSYLSPDSKVRSQDLEEIEILKSHILELKSEAQADRIEAKSKKEEYFELVKKFREQRDRWLEKALEKAQKKIENIIEDARLNRVKNKTLHDIKSELPEIIKARPSQTRIQTLEEFKAHFKPGTPAFLSRLGRQVLLQSEPDHKGQVTVLADSMRLQVPWHQLSLVHGELKVENNQTILRRSARSEVTSASPELSGELDLRGRRTDEALELLEKFLDNCMLEQKDRVKIIHGFGTELLKKAIRQFLSKSRYVEKWKGGDNSTGGDGVTWVNIAN